ncbi:hypothetical protein CEXT_408621 [Caerostris extrusa]|uniref:Uncharacterized protein n=1 Tax=Caerostris extrusa TaxID=172846 RepID=A0AAV4MI21_CAEEX|nr:hypothetical protein CEXT_408621 [Caerostris extrusa]
MFAAPDVKKERDRSLILFVWEGCGLQQVVKEAWNTFSLIKRLKEIGDGQVDSGLQQVVKEAWNTFSLIKRLKKLVMDKLIAGSKSCERSLEIKRLKEIGDGQVKQSSLPLRTRYESSLLYYRDIGRFFGTTFIYILQGGWKAPSLPLLPRHWILCGVNGVEVLTYGGAAHVKGKTLRHTILIRNSLFLTTVTETLTSPA